MITSLQYVTIIIRDLDEALDFYTNKLGLEKRMDLTNPKGRRWVTVGIKGQKSPEIILQVPDKDEHGIEQFNRKIGQIGNGTTWVFHVDDCLKTMAEFKAHGVTIVEDAVESSFGISGLISDLYGNLFTITQIKSGKEQQ